MDYLERNQEDFDFFSCPDDSYEYVLEQLDNLEVGLSCRGRLHSVLKAPLPSILHSLTDCLHHSFKTRQKSFLPPCVGATIGTKGSSTTDGGYST